jgi:parallel beta-helix repeat protein
VIERVKGRSSDYAMVRVQGGAPGNSPSITGCTFGNGTAKQGIYVTGSPQITSNTFTGFSDAAVQLQSTQTAIVSGNTFTDNSVGVHIIYSGNTEPTVTGNTHSGSTDADVRVSGNIYKDVAWNESAGTVYRIASGLGIEDGGQLTITNGVIVKVDPDKVIWVQTGGVMSASGATFTTADANNEWDGIWFYTADSRSRLENCLIERVKGRSSDYAMIRVQGDTPGNSPSITGCIIGNGTAKQGIYVTGSPQITGNTFTGFSDAAVQLQSTQTAMVTGNTFTDNSVGVHIIYSGNTAPTVSGNTYSNSTEADVRVSGNIYKDVAWNEGAGTVYRVAPGNAVLGIEENARLTITDGVVVKVEPGKIIWVQGGVLEATGVTFTAADLNNEWNAIWFYSGDFRSRLENCVIERAEGRSTEGYAMVYVVGGTAGNSPNIIGCTIGNGNALRGINVLGSSPQILNNTISGFSDYGVYISGSSAPFIAGNTITGNRIGIGLTTTKSGLYRANRIQGNSEYGISNGSSSSYPVADARYNWWGNSTGPTIASNPLGTGDRITTKVDYLPWAGSIADTDADGMWDEWELQQFTNLATASAGSDYDDDGLLDKDEFLYGTDPKAVDSDGDGVFDGLEVQVGMNPSLAGDYNIDSDNDTYSNLREQISGTDPYDTASIPPVLSDGDPLPVGDGDVDGRDLTGLISEFGRTNCAPCKYDLDTDGDVDVADLFLFSEDFGRMTP